MKCPSCGHPDSKVIDSRPTDNDSIRRRRECQACQRRFTTYETYDPGDFTPMIVIKKDGSRELFDRNKILTGILAACYKQNVPSETIDQMVADVEAELKNTLRTEFTSQEIGKLVMERLKPVNEVSYVRFASVYREFKDVDTFLSEIDQLLRRKEPRD